MDDINECVVDPAICRGGRCVNTDGSFRCECPVGYRLDPSGRECVDSDECASEAGICGNGTCKNVVGSFECDCASGFAPGADGRCADIDECYEPEVGVGKSGIQWVMSLDPSGQSDFS